jgi:hypothetical protein
MRYADFREIPEIRAMVVIVALLFLYSLICWRSNGRRLWTILFPWMGGKARAGWTRLATPRRCIFYDTNDKYEHELVKSRFIEHSQRIEELIEGVLRKDLGANTQPLNVLKQRWRCLVDGAGYYSIRRQIPLFAGGWAQTRTPSNSKCILGLEPLYCLFKPIAEDAIGHELVHVAQEAREQGLRKEWFVTGWPSLRHTFAMEGEAWLTFRLIPGVFVIAWTLCILYAWGWPLVWR